MYATAFRNKCFTVFIFRSSFSPFHFTCGICLLWYNTHFGMSTAVKVTLVLTGGFLMLAILLSIKDNVFYFHYRQQEDFDG